MANLYPMRLEHLVEPVLGHLCRIPVVAGVGHLLGGSGGVEGVITTLALHHQIFPPTANLENPDPACDLDYVPVTAQPGVIRAALSNSFGFGGHNGVVALKRWDAAAV